MLSVRGTDIVYVMVLVKAWAHQELTADLDLAWA